MVQELIMLHSEGLYCLAVWNDVRAITELLPAHGWRESVAENLLRRHDRLTTGDGVVGGQKLLNFTKIPLPFCC